jgi:hypothetical protein
VEADASKGAAEWLEPVSDEDYEKANKNKRGDN